MLIRASIILPAYNCENYIQQCLDSLLAQTFSDFELIIFNDASTDQTLNIINSYKDPRIRIINSPSNQGYIAHLNHGFEIAKGEFIVRMDADDICLPDRLELQINFLEANPDYGLCGTWVDPIGPASKKNIWKLPMDHDSILVHQFFYNTALAHPSVVFRKNLIQINDIKYDQSFMPAEDYELWTRLSYLTKFKNIDQPLLKYRQHPDQISQIKEAQKISALTKIRKAQLELLNIAPTANELRLSTAISNKDFTKLGEDLDLTSNWLLRIHKSNEKLARFDQELFNKELSYLWWMICTSAARSFGRGILDRYKSSVLTNFYQPSVYARFKFFIKSNFGI